MKASLKLILIIVITLLAAFVLLKYVAPLLAPFIIAVFVSLVMEPLVNFLESKVRLSRGWSVLLAMLVFISAFVTMAWLVIRRLIIELIDLSASLPGLSQQVWRAILRLQDNFLLSLPEPIIKNYPKITQAVQDNINSLVKQLENLTGSLLNSLINAISGITGIFIILLVATIATFFFSRDRGMIVRFWLGLLPEPWGRKSIEVTKEIFRALVGYIKAQITLVAITMVINIIGLYMINAKYALVMGIVIGLFDLMPVLGPGSIHVPWVIWSIVQGNTAFGIKLLVLYIIALVVRQIVEPKLVAHHIGLHPLATLMAMYVGLQIFGIAGLVLGPLFVITVKAVADAANVAIIK